MASFGTRTYWRASPTGVLGQLVTERFPLVTTTFSSPGGPIARRSGVTGVTKPVGRTVTLGRGEYSGGRFGTPRTFSGTSQGYIAAQRVLAGRTGAVGRAARATLRLLGLFGRTFELAALGELLYGPMNWEAFDPAFWATTAAQPPYGWQLNQDCGVMPRPPAASFASGSNCGGVAQGINPPSSAFNPAWGSLEEWGAIPQPNFFQWRVLAKWVPGTGDPAEPWRPAVTLALGAAALAPPTLAPPVAVPRMGTRQRVDGRTGRSLRYPYKVAAETYVFPRIGGRGPVRARTGWHDQLPSRPTAKGKGAIPRGMFLALRLFHAATELGDFVDALYDALGPFKCKGAKTIQARMFCVGKNWDRFFTDPAIMAAAMRNLVMNEVEDRIMGRLYGAGWQTGVRPFRDTYGSGAWTDTVGDALLGGGDHVPGSEHGVVPVWTL